MCSLLLVDSSSSAHPSIAIIPITIDRRRTSPHNNFVLCYTQITMNDVASSPSSLNENPASRRPRACRVLWLSTSGHQPFRSWCRHPPLIQSYPSSSVRTSLKIKPSTITDIQKILVAKIHHSLFYFVDRCVVIKTKNTPYKIHLSNVCCNYTFV